MADEQSIIIGFGVISFLFAYYSTVFAKGGDGWTTTISRFFFSLSLVFVLLIINTLYLATINTVQLNYLDSTVMAPTLMVVYYSVVIGVALYILYLIYSVLKSLGEMYKSWETRERAKPIRQHRGEE